MLGFEVAQSTVSKYMVRGRRPPSQSWRTFLRNHMEVIAAIDMCVVPTLTFERLFAFLVLSHGRRQLLWFEVTRHPTAEWLLKFWCRQRDSSVWYLKFPNCVTDIGPSRLTTWQLDRDRSGYRPRSDIRRRTYPNALARRATTWCRGFNVAQTLQNRQIAPRGTERKFFNDFSRAPALAYAQGHVGPEPASSQTASATVCRPLAHAVNRGLVPSSIPDIV